MPKMAAPSLSGCLPAGVPCGLQRPVRLDLAQGLVLQGGLDACVLRPASSARDGAIAIVCAGFRTCVCVC